MGVLNKLRRDRSSLARLLKKERNHQLGSREDVASDHQEAGIHSTPAEDVFNASATGMHTSEEADPGAHISTLQDDKSTREGKYSKLVITAFSLVDFVLSGIRDVGQNIPGIGTVGIAQKAMKKLKVHADNQKDMDDIVEYIKALCGNAGLEPTGEGNHDLQSESLIADLRRELAKVKKPEGWRDHALDVVNAEVVKDKLDSIWKGIQRALEKHGLKLKVLDHDFIEKVYQTMLKDHETMKAIHENQMVQITIQEQQDMDRILRELPTAKGASSDSRRTEQAQIVPCCEGTREQVLSQIWKWALCSGNHVGCAHIFWLNGLAGTGKSTIAATVAGWARRSGILGGSFFFARSVLELNNPSLVFPTLASQLAQFDERFKRALYHVLKEDKFIASSNLENQFDRLIRRPFAACEGSRPILLMLDALDECAPEADVKKMLSLLLNPVALGSGGSILRIFITSRPEAHIRFMFSRTSDDGPHEQVVLHEIDRDTARNDIQTYLAVKFAEMKSGRHDLPPLPIDWPSSEDFSTLLENCGQFFSYAATAMRFIGDEGVRDPAGQLHEILDSKGSQHALVAINPHHDLDCLYLSVLQRALFKNPRKAEYMRCVIATVVCLREPMSVSDLAHFLCSTPDFIRNTLHHLHSLVVVPDSKSFSGDHSVDSVRFFHKSFPDFIQDEGRCTDTRFWVNTSEHETFMALRCMRSNGFPDSITDYTVVHWHSHLQSGTTRFGEDRSIDNEGMTEHWHQSHTTEPDIDGTAEEVFRAIQEWALSADVGGIHIQWLYGITDAGKSMSKFLRWARANAREGSIFLGNLSFSSGALMSRRRNYQTIIPTLASQLALHDIGYASELYDAIVDSGGDLIWGRDFEWQFQHLIRLPLCKTQGSTSVLIVLDAFDEIDENDKPAVDLLLRVLSQPNDPTIGLRLRLLITTKAEELLEAHHGPFKLLNDDDHREHVKFHDLSEFAAPNEIMTYLGAELDLPKDSAREIMNRCGTSMTYAATAARFIRSEGLGEFLDMIDRRYQDIADDSRPFHNLDNLYLRLLQRLAEKNCNNIERVRFLIATIICVRVPMSIMTLAQFVSSALEEIRLSLQELHSVLFVPSDVKSLHWRNRTNVFYSVKDFYDEPSTSIKIFHPSFSYFIQDETRCRDKRFLIDIRAHEGYMASQCANANAKTYFREFNQEFPNTLKYGINHWHYHLQSGTCADLVGIQSPFSSVSWSKQMGKESNFPETQKYVQGVIQTWATERRENGKNLFLLHGSPGNDETSIVAMAIAKWAVEEKAVIGASFFFDWELKELHSPRLILPTLASQLSQNSPQYRHALCNELEVNGECVLSEEADIQWQLDNLLRNPILACQGEQPILIVLGDIEEPLLLYAASCIRKLVQMVGSGSRLRILIAGSSAAFSFFKNDVPGEVTVYDFEEHIAPIDMRTYIVKALFSLRETEKEWLSSDKLERLLEYCGTSLSFAATANTFIGEGEGHPEERLDAIMEMMQKDIESTGPHRRIGKLYLGILHRAATKRHDEKYLHSLWRVIATIACSHTSFVSLQVDWRHQDLLKAFVVELSAMTGLTKSSVHDVLEDLRPMMVSQLFKTEMVTVIFRTSFIDFLENETPYADKKILAGIPEHCTMALRWMERMRKDDDKGKPLLGLSQWILLVKSRTRFELSDELTQELIWLVGDEERFVRYYTDFLDYLNNWMVGDIIPFLRSLVGEHQLKKHETFLDLLDRAEANERIAKERKRYLYERRRWFGLTPEE